MTEPRPSEEFSDLLLKSEEVIAACKAELGDQATSLIDRAGKEDAIDFLDWFDEWRSNDPHEESIIEGAAPDDDVFNICINRSGPLHWIQANEFDDICYFDSEKDAGAYANMEFSSFIETLNERLAEES